MTNQHPITPPLELIREWCAHSNEHETYDQFWCHIATQAARWGADQQLKLDAEQIAQAYQAGADQELEACCKWLEQNGEQWKLPYELRAARRPQPPSLKEQALEVLNLTQKGWGLAQVDLDTIRRALEALPND
jgi:hypothetical protein